MTPDVQQRKVEFARCLHSLVPDLHHADDLYQQTALIPWGKLDEYDRGRSFFAWACGAARLEAANCDLRAGRGPVPVRRPGRR